MQPKKHFATILLTTAILLALPLAVGADMIPNGIDAWVTPDDGRSSADFTDDPIPAGFFCDGSRAFSDRIYWKGEPIVTRPAEAFGGADTLVQRLDDAVFDENGVAHTRVQVQVLSMVSSTPLETACGRFSVKVTLAGEQPVTTMLIVREEPNGGYFVSDVHLRVKLTFTPLDGFAREILEIDRLVEFNDSLLYWSNQAQPGRAPLQVGGFVLTDTDDDGVVDTVLPGTSEGFFLNSLAAGQKASRVELGCHTSTAHDHCNYQEP